MAAAVEEGTGNGPFGTDRIFDVDQVEANACGSTDSVSSPSTSASK
jgi:hypothetical protein